MTNTIKNVTVASKKDVKPFSLDSAEIQHKQGNDYKPKPITLNWLGIFFIILFSVLSLGIYLIVCAVHKTWILPKFCLNITSRPVREVPKHNSPKQPEINEDGTATPPKDQGTKTSQTLPEEEVFAINTSDFRSAPDHMRGTIVIVHNLDHSHDILRNFHPQSYRPFGQLALPRLDLHRNLMRSLYAQPSRLYFDQPHGLSPSLQLNPYLSARQLSTRFSPAEFSFSLSNTRAMRQLLNRMQTNLNQIDNYFDYSQNPYLIPMDSNLVTSSDSILPPSSFEPLSSFEQHQAQLREIESRYTSNAHSFALLNSQLPLQSSFMHNQSPVLAQEPILEEVEEETINKSNAHPKQSLVPTLEEVVEESNSP